MAPSNCSCCTYNIDSIADSLANGHGAPDDSDALADEVGRAQEALGKGKRILDKLKAEGESLARTRPGSQRLTAYRSQYLRLAKAFVDAARSHQQAKVRSGTLRPLLPDAVPPNLRMQPAVAN